MNCNLPLPCMYFYQRYFIDHISYFFSGIFNSYYFLLFDVHLFHHFYGNTANALSWTMLRKFPKQALFDDYSLHLSFLHTSTFALLTIAASLHTISLSGNILQVLVSSKLSDWAYHNKISGN